MKKTIVGKRIADYKGDDGQQHKGITLYYTGAAEGVEGLRTGDVYIKAPGQFYDIAKDLPVGSKAYIFLNNRGRFEGIELSEVPEPQEAVKK